MVGTCEGTKDISRKVDHIQIAYMYHQAHGYFVLLDIGNIGNQGLPNPLLVSVLKNYPKIHRKYKNLYERLRSHMISKKIEGSIYKDLS